MPQSPSFRGSAVRTACCAAVCGMLLAGGAAAAPKAAAKPAKHLPVETGRVVYKITGSAMNGTSTLAWTEGGKKFRQEVNGKITRGEQSMDMKSWSIGDGKNLYAHQPMLGPKQAMRMKMPQGGPGVGAPGMPLIAVGDKQGKVVGKATVLGKPCEIREAGMARIWAWQGLPMRMEMSNPQGFSMKMVATKLETSPKLSPSLFKVPPGFQVKDWKMPAGSPGTPGGRRPLP